MREYKGPTVDDVLAAETNQLDYLPGRVQSMEDSVRQGDFRGAEEHLQRAVGLLLRGPGHRRSRLQGLMLPTMLWMWFATLLGLLVWLVA